MFQYILKRLAIIPPALLLVHFLGYSYAHIVYPMRAKSNPYLAQSIDPEPLFESYLGHLGDIFNNNLPSFQAINEDVSVGFFSMLIEPIINSFGLLAIALFFSVILGIALGVFFTKTNPVRTSKWLTSLSSLGLSLPGFFIGSLFFAGWFISVKIFGPEVTDLLPPFQGHGWDEHLIIPTLVLMARPTVQIAQITSTLLVDEMTQQYVKAARSIGHSWRTIRVRLAFKNILAAVVVGISGSMRLIVAELIIVESLFNWEGIGRSLANSLIPSGFSSSFGSSGSIFLNAPLVSMILVAFSFLFLITDLFTSVISRVVDPRLRLS